MAKSRRISASPERGRACQTHSRHEQGAGHSDGIKDYEGGIIDEKEVLEKLPRVSELAVGDACTGSNPRAITPAVMEKCSSVRL
jgi:hypothetical protein